MDDHDDEDKENYNPQRIGLDTAPASMHHISGFQTTEGDNTTALDGAPGLSHRAAAGVSILPKDSSAQQSRHSTTLSEKMISNGGTSTLPRLDDDESVGFNERAYEEGRWRLVRSSPR
ncbi:MAG: hypothetical protein Q9204_005762 [Flavoplaca sp. TL-2023a]